MYEIAVKDVSDEANDASDSDERDDLRLLPKLLPVKPGFIWTRVLLLLLLQPNAEILCQAAGSIICYGLLGYSKIFLLISGDCRCRWGMTSRSWVVVVVVLAVAAEDAAASGQMSCSDLARSQELALSFLSENELIKFFSVAPMPFPGVCESAE